MIKGFLKPFKCLKIHLILKKILKNFYFSFSNLFCKCSHQSAFFIKKSH
ncbi:hypothetical protein HPSA20_0715 [Helicobacter pylori SouthAfrica20]|uniref:Uncharacterized protein n=1 Tax=Helicobacter pylori SouthAfrica20 TaxID=1352356 RepID=T1UAL5_HELPX|nr:hypothetical protein HPSA20_0715 [Helicobacter pylori SouthAfrica20]